MLDWSCASYSITIMKQVDTAVIGLLCTSEVI